MTTALARSKPIRRAVRRGRVRLPDRSNVPAWIRIAAAVTIGAALVTGLGLAATTADTRAGVDALGSRTAPQVTATQELAFALADMDAQVSNVVLAGNDSTLTELRTQAIASYETRRKQAGANLQQATLAAPTPEVAQRLRDLLDRFGRYQALAANTIQLNDLDGHPAGLPSARTVAAHRDSTDTLRDLLADVRAVTDAGNAALTRDNTDAQRSVTDAQIRHVLLGVLLLGTLIGLQVMLRVLARRWINPALVVATVLAGALVVGGYAGNSTAADRLAVAEEDAFGSLVTLRQARAVSYDANADESRYLLDPDRAARYTQAFLDRSESLAEVRAPEAGAYAQLLDQALLAYWKNGEIRIGGSFGTELRNVTFAGERAAAGRTLTLYQAYQRDDRTLRDKASVDLREAIAYCASTSNDDFYAYDRSLVELIDINQRGFDDAIAEATDALRGWTGWLPYGGTALIALLVLIGIRPRLAEYR